MNGTLLITGRLARAELRKLFTTRALPVSFAIAIVLAIGSVIIDAMVAGKNGSPRLGTDAAVYQMLKFGAITCVVMLILGILAAGSEFRHRTIVPVLLATPQRARVFAVKVAVVAGLGAVFSAVTFGLGLGTVVATLSAHGVHHLPPGVARLYLGTVVSAACFGMIGVALGALTRNTIGAIVAAIAWTLFVEQVILAAIVPGIEKWLPTGAAIGLTNASGPGSARSLPAGVAGVVLAGTVLAGYGIVMLLAASRTTIRRDVV
ncbi:MAG TPA: ABC transporter permease [Streptosporangiaceae bacterium]